MKNKGKVLLILCFVLAVIVLGTLHNNKYFNLNNNYITRQDAALYLSAIEMGVTTKKSDGAYKDVAKNSRYQPYIKYAVQKHLMELAEDKFCPNKEFVYRDGLVAAKAYDLDLKQFSFSFSSEKKMKKTDFWELYDCILKARGKQAKVRKETALFIREQEKVITTKGLFQKVTLNKTSVANEKAVALYIVEDNLLEMRETTDSIKINNAYVEKVEQGILHVFAGEVNFTLEGRGNAAADQKKVVADLYVSGNRAEKMVVKPDLIQGKVVAVTKDSIEIEGYGKLQLDQQCQSYKVYGDTEMEETLNQLVGYNVAKFVVGKKKIVTALVMKPIDAKFVRVLIKSSNYQSDYHSKAVFKADCDLVISNGKQSKTIKTGKKYIVSQKDSWLKKGRIYIKPKKENGKTKLLSVQRSSGVPEYRGSFEVVKEGNQLVIVNEVDLEQYLYAVVPSEMPISYGEEALKVQAVCARSFVYNHLKQPSFKQYGAHVDDSVNSQVYNNSPECKASINAVNETYGQVAKAGKEVVTAYFFSTSCGSTSDKKDVWGDGKNPEYLKGMLQTKNAKEIDLSSNEAFVKFLKEGSKEPLIEQDEPWFRWKTTFTKKQFVSSLKDKLPGMMQYCTVYDLNLKKTSLDVSKIKKVKEIKVVKRGKSGVAKEVIIKTNQYVIVVNWEYGIRSLLLPTMTVVQANDGSRQTMSMLPSGYLTFEMKKNSITINGGGYGHGVGMSQNGVRVLAKGKLDYVKILQHYFGSIQLWNIYSQS